MKIWVVFSLVLMNQAALNIYGKSLMGYTFSSLLSKYLRLEFPGHMAYVYYFFKAAKCIFLSVPNIT